MKNQTYRFAQKDINKSSLDLGDTTIILPGFLKAGGITKFRINILDNNIYLERKCKGCNTFFPVQIFDTILNDFTDINNCKIERTNTSFNCRCITCQNKLESLSKEKVQIRTKSNVNSETCQLNVNVSTETRNFLKIRSIRNNTTLKKEVITAIEFYKEYIEKNKGI